MGEGAFEIFKYLVILHLWTAVVWKEGAEMDGTSA